MNIRKSVRLSFTDSASDKQHVIRIVELPDGSFENLHQHGANGRKLTDPLVKGPFKDFAAADKALTSFINGKTRKGYTIDEQFGEGAALASPLAAGVRQRVKSSIPIQLLRQIGEAELESIIRDDGWMLQLKANGERLVAETLADGSTRFVNRQGIETTASRSIAGHLSQLVPGSTVDGEILGDVFYVFDLLAEGGNTLTSCSYRERFCALKSVVEAIGDGPVKLIPFAEGEEAKRALLANVRAINAEGVTGKKLSAAHTEGKAASGGPAVKFKLVESATFIVIDPPTATSKRSAGIALLDGGEIISCGRVTIPANKTLPLNRAIVEVGYLYAENSHSLHQPVYQGERSDIPPDECVLAQLKYGNRQAEALLAS